MSKPARLQVENVLQPRKTYTVDAEKFEAMKAALLQVAPSSAPGMTPAEIRNAVLPLLPPDLFPGGDKAGWWVKAVQLDQEAKTALVRSEKSPARLHKS
jgi:hypothetical protein